MQNKTTQHKHRILYAVKRSIIRLLKTENMIKDYIIMIIIKKIEKKI